jgi:hypothetical protein
MTSFGLGTYFQQPVAISGHLVIVGARHTRQLTVYQLNNTGARILSQIATNTAASIDSMVANDKYLVVASNGYLQTYATSLCGPGGIIVSDNLEHSPNSHYLAGYFDSGSFVGNCTRCPQRTYQPLSNQTSCWAVNSTRHCRIGEYDTSDRSTPVINCSSCPPGRYNDMVCVSGCRRVEPDLFSLFRLTRQAAISKSVPRGNTLLLTARIWLPAAVHPAR